MGFNYSKKEGHGGDSMWTSYSDLFLGLSIIFLLLYVSASLRQGTDGIKQAIENKQLVKQNEDLKQQMKVYENLKQDYLQKQASTDEQSNYEELMKQLNLLQDQAKDEKNQLRTKADENAKKEVALNKYQQMIRNIINSNMIAKARIKSRDNLIESKDEIITEKSNEITSLETTVNQKSVEIQKGEQKISGLENQLDKRMKQLQAAFRAHQITKQKFQAEKQAIEHETENKISMVRQQNQKTKAELDQAAQELQATNQKLAQTNNQLAQTSTQLNQAKGNIAQLGQANSALQGELAQADVKRQADENKLKGQFEAQKAADRAAFENQLAKEKLSGAQRAAKEAQFKAAAEQKANDLRGQLGDLDKKFKATQGELAKANENLNARKKLADQISKNFASKGIKAEVDAGSGDVLLSFNGQYFDTGKADLKPGMRAILEQAMPAYSQSLFSDPKISEKIQSVEIVGFASPTYKGKYVDPTSLDPQNRQAVNYNLDLSYNRARSIFNYVFDKNKMAFHNQERLLPLVKVTGRSFLASDKTRDPANMSGGNANGGFCRSNDCAKLQRVVIKFTLKD